ncbi:transporter substrate-binding domain-containing protein [Brevibacterium jeotgali]|uniref:Extracellular solute-binding protein, family 3 n=1 Tax=Brevibacterium jeotgali TaxID=1262550 RepID=A0A2H1L3T1_9MICO|nr:transporter substrate-binding domain-containing protein [Brevibacterium jeotgali]TWC03040.1 extracellular solute-binding protein (family 3) [Brevibacterium jeotgali]SMY11063.1 extracellular solute-binding protein, family 3 [Brevibacterium jeotgali]
MDTSSRLRISRRGRLLGLAVAALLLTGCGSSFPADPEGTLDRIEGGELRVGVSHSPPWTDVSAESEPTGVEPRLVRDFAQAHDAELAWEAGGEEQLMTMLDEGRIDMVVGGLTDSSPWTTHAALTTPYAESVGPDGSTSKHVLAVRTGENAFMVALERHALAQELGTVEP